ncbi:50S ribosomal protein L10 [Gloeobacter kilaueensis]|uniref:Large ribosomal subunit protein uL10 n=1 Tax=Gloeobacter kilaueensis (strain ATCC BAA-2537 / CCAP 1431/1 / ULC 316 / JS1) TaxID=1183438 RepID=U5QGT9_GLOK1|nr:50S ribosomal protein L10 [Gloeobacter kilaueensis]AGY58197.1 50S ribosomal protein L10 [Gloeobacter kilaueensis JS1]
MGKRPAKEFVVGEIKELLDRSNVVIVMDYRGLSVAEITDFRRKLRPLGSSCVVAKNTLMNVALRESRFEQLEKLLKGPSAFIFAEEKLRDILKLYEGFQRDTKKTDLRGGVAEGLLFEDLQQLKQFSELPTKEELMGQVAGAILSLPTKIAVGVKEIPSGLARAIAAIEKQKQEQSAA